MLDDINKDASTRMQKSVESLSHDLQRLRTGRASTALVESIQVPYYGSDVPLSQVANVVVKDSRTLAITPWEKPMVKEVERAILGSDMGVTPNVAGTTIRLIMPVLTEERRRELAKHVAHEAENAKVAVRNIRRDAIQQVKELLKEKEISEDEDHRAADDIQKLTDQFVGKIDEVAKAKEDELMSM